MKYWWLLLLCSCSMEVAVIDPPKNEVVQDRNYLYPGDKPSSGLSCVPPFRIITIENGYEVEKVFDFPCDFSVSKIKASDPPGWGDTSYEGSKGELPPIHDPGVNPY